MAAPNSNQLLPTSSDDSAGHRLSSGNKQQTPSTLHNSRLLRAGTSQDHAATANQEIFILPRQKSRSRDRRESRMFLVDGQLCWTDDLANAGGAANPVAGGQSMPAGFMPGKRSSSIGLMFGSSMDLSGYGQSIDSSGGGGSGNEEAISYRIKWCRDNIMQLKRQTWPMEKKLQVLKASKLFIKQHQGELKQSKQAKDVLAGTSAIFERYWRHFRREFANFLVIITPWEMRIKKIESHFGSVVASYFTFLRWIFWLNLANSLVLCSFVMVPELIENVPDLTGMRKGELGMKRSTDTDADKMPEFNPTLGEMWEFEGFLKFSPIFYGYYSNVEISRSGFWRNPLAFLLSAMLTYLFCFCAISRKLSQNTKMSRIGSKDDEYTFCWTVFVGWDFMIGNSETAYNKTSSLVMNLKEGILEEKEQTKDRDWSLIMRRVFANVLTIMLIVASAYVVTLAVQRSENLPEDASLLQKNELQLVMSGIQFMFPPLFDVIGIIEKYHPRKALSWQLGRILFLDFLNFYTLMFSLFGTVDQMTHQLNEVSGNITLFRKNTTYYTNLFTTTTTTTTTTSAPTTITTTTISSLIENITLSTNSSAALDMANGTSANSSVVSFVAGVTTANGTNLLESLTPNNISSSVIEYKLDGGSNTTSIATNLTGTQRDGMNASGMFTSILLASSTMMPSTITSVGLDQSTASQISPMSTTTMTYSTTPMPFLVMSTSITSIQQVDGAATPMTLLSIEQTEATATTTTGSSKEDEDYPDIQDILGTDGSQDEKRRKKREIKAILQNRYQDEIEHDETILIDHDQHSNLPHEIISATTTHQRLTGLPPIQDPYKKLGQNQFRRTQEATTRTATIRGHSTLILGPEDPEEEEPLEGRLEVHHHYHKTTKRPLTKNGFARPIGGGQQNSRVVAGGGKKKPSPADLNSDTNEDLLPEDEQDPSRSILISVTGAAASRQRDTASDEFVEPTTEQQQLSAAESSSAETTFDQTVTTPGTFGDGSGGTSSTGNGDSNQDNGGEVTSRAGFASSGTSSTLADPTLSVAEFGTNLKPGLKECVGGSGQVAYMSNVNQSGDLTLSGGNLTTSHLLQSTVKLNGTGQESSTDCAEIPEFKHQEILALNSTLKDKLKSLCWETMFGQEMVKMVVMDLVMTIVSAVSFEFLRACFVRYCNRFFFWDLERGFPGYQDFKIAENVLHLVNNQSTVWMGMFFAPGLPAINTVKLAVLMYVRSWAVLTCNIPHETVFKVSKSNNFYYWILLINLLICILPVAYAVTWIRPSWHCGPFGGECRMYLVVTKLLKQLLPPEANSVFRYVTSPGAVIPILIALILIIYYLASTVSSSKEANKELKAQLKKDKEQESAVPEITNTTVADPADSTQVPASATTQAPLVHPSTTTLNPMAGPMLSASSGGAASTSAGGVPNPMLSPSSGNDQANAGATNTRPKSLLMPPPI